MRDGTDSQRERGDLPRAELDQLCLLACGEWTAGGEMPSLASIRERGSAADYELAINRLTKHDDAERDREVAQRAYRLRAPRAD